MGLFDKLQRNIALGMNPDDPLFGGLIPRRIIEDERPQQRTISDSNLPAMPRPVDRIRPSGIDKVGRDIAGGKQPANVQIDWTPEQLKLESRKLDLSGNRLTHEQNIAQSELGLKEREQSRKELEDKNKLGIEKSKLDIDKDKVEIDQRKAALDEWKSKNPEGEVQTLKDGKIVIIDKRTGKNIDTGLHSDHLSEEEKLKITAKNAQELEELRQRGRLKLEGSKNKIRNINPSQQRTAERDAANEILNDPNYAWLTKKYIKQENDGSITINRPDKTKYPQENFTIDAFEKEWKKRSEERMNKTFGDTNVSTEEIENTIDMTAPDGRKLKVPASEVQRMKDAGAKLVGEEFVKPVEPMPPIDDKIELFYDREGKVIGARNRKASGISKFEEQ